MDTSELSKPIRTKVVEQLTKSEDAKAALRQVISGAVVDSVKNNQFLGYSRSEQLEAIARGALEGLLLLNKDLASGSVLVMQAVVEAANQLGLDPEFMMRWALVGIAQVGKVAPKGTIFNIRAALDNEFLGVGEVFDKTCDEVAP